MDEPLAILPMLTEFSSEQEAVLSIQLGRKARPFGTCCSKSKPCLHASLASVLTAELSSQLFLRQGLMRSAWPQTDNVFEGDLRSFYPHFWMLGSYCGVLTSSNHVSLDMKHSMIHRYPQLFLSDID